MELEVLTLSKVGGRARNEDACGVWHNEQCCVLVLCDGAGGHLGGDVASRLAVKHILSTVQRQPHCAAAIIDNALRAANAELVGEQRRQPKLHDMRTTAVLLTIDRIQLRAQWGHVGDSRLYHFRAGRIATQTRDHSVVQSMVDAGYLTADAMRTAPERNKLLAALGDADHFEPSIASDAVPIRDGDAFLLCSDGFWEYVLEVEMEATLAQTDTAASWLNAMEAYVLERGGATQDNYSAMVVRCSDPNDHTVPAAR